MRSPAEASSTAVGRSSDLLDQVDYRLAETPQEKEEIYNLRYRAYLREGAVAESPEQRVTDQYDDLPNSWTFGVYIRSEEHTSELQSHLNLVCRLLLEKKKKKELVLADIAIPAEPARNC